LEIYTQDLSNCANNKKNEGDKKKLWQVYIKVDENKNVPPIIKKLVDFVVGLPSKASVVEKLAIDIVDNKANKEGQ
jgi:hypothetical protein